MKLRIRNMREDNDLTQTQVAGILMCDQSLYSKYERGEREPGLEMLENMADFFNVDLDYLLGKSDIPNKSLELLQKYIPNTIKIIPIKLFFSFTFLLP